MVTVVALVSATLGRRMPVLPVEDWVAGGEKKGSRLVAAREGRVPSSDVSVDA